jgi:hypothetical protein
MTKWQKTVPAENGHYWLRYRTKAGDWKQVIRFVFGTNEKYALVDAPYGATYYDRRSRRYTKSSFNPLESDYVKVTIEWFPVRIKWLPSISIKDLPK